MRYPYALLAPVVPGPANFPVAQLIDLATNKLAAIATRGLRRDFWDLYAIHVIRGLTWFDDAEQVAPVGMTTALWTKVRRYFEREAPTLVFPRKP